MFFSASDEPVLDYIQSLLKFIFWKWPGFNTQHLHYCFALGAKCKVIFYRETSMTSKKDPTNDKAFVPSHEA